MKLMEERIQKMDIWDIGLVKLSVAAFVLFVITIWPAAMNLVHSISPWYFLIAFVIFAVRPLYKMYIKSE